MAETFFRVRKGIIVSNTTSTANLEPTALTVGSTVVNAAGVYTGVVNATTVNAGAITGITSLPSLASITVTGSFNVGALFTANSTLVNTAAINVTGQVNTATFFAATSANVGANVQLTTTSLSIGNTSVNTFANSSHLRITGALNANSSIGTANQALLSNGTVAYYGDVEMLGVSRAHNVQTANYTLVLSDAGKSIICSNVTSMNVTVPNNATVAFANDSYVNIIQFGVGLVTVGNAASVSLFGRNGKRTGGQYAWATLTKVDVNTWIVGGDVQT